MRPGKLTAEERKQYEDAKLKAATDPAVVAATQDRTAAQQEYEHAIKTEIIAKDPSMAPLLDKAAAKSPAAPPAASPAMKEEAPAAAPRGPMRKGAGPWANLAPEERQKLSKARKAVQSNPAVVQAEAKRKTAEKAYRDALHAAMLKADPTIAPLLEKMDAAMKGGGRGMGGEGKKGEKGHRKSAAKPGAPESATTPASDSQAESDKGM